MEKNRNALLTSALTVALALAIMISSNVAFGNDLTALGQWKSIDGAICAANNGTQEKYLRHRYSGTLNKSATKKVNVTCPLLRENQSADKLGTVNVYINQGSSSITRCWLRISNYTNSITYTKAKSKQGSGQVHFSNPPAGGDPQWGNASVQCRLAPNCQLESIYYYEFQ